MEEVRAAARVEWARAEEFAARVFRAIGVEAADAARAAEALVDADGHGTVTHGLKNLRNYVSAVLAGDVNPRPRIHDVGGGAAARVLSADNALGHVAGWAGMEAAIALARQFGVGTVFVRDSNHYGASGFWARLALRHNMVGFAFTSALATMAPWGAREKLVGNNPPAWAIPTRVVGPGAPLAPAEAESVCLDIALSVVAGNRLDIYRRRGEPIPSGWALDRDGEPTTDPHAPRQGGSFRPLGEYKGSGLAIVLGMMSCFLAGAPFDDQRLTSEGRQVYGTCSHWFAAYDVAQFTDPQRFTAEVRDVRARLHKTTPRAGVERVFAPGDIENANAQRHAREGIPLEQFTLDDLRWVAERTGIAFDLVPDA
jgi:LDH2 family malate/lactate/ureidoglycolate dehydrogenase